MDKNNPLKSDLETGITYLLCPDSSCRFFNPSDKIPLCESQCPQQDELVKIIRCKGCGDMIELDGNHTIARRVVHDGCGVMNFRLSFAYELVYERPE